MRMTVKVGTLEVIDNGVSSGELWFADGFDGLLIRGHKNISKLAVVLNFWLLNGRLPTPDEVAVGGGE